MPKALAITPALVRQKQVLKINDIPVNQYSKTLAEERKNYSDATLVGVLEDMLLIREFETMLDKIKKEGVYENIKYDHAGPAHLSIGQEASAVGQALALEIEDHIFGSHRSHGEILAKGMSAIRKLDEKTLDQVMSSFDGGTILNIIGKSHPAGTRALAKDFLVYGALAEIFHRRPGFNKGLGGSMHAFFTPFGVYPNNALVGGSADIACGAALFKKVNQKPGITVSNIGDASMGCGPVWEAMNFAGMDQFHQLWDESHKGGLPIIFNFMNNFYGMGGQTAGETMSYGILARVGAGVNADGMHAERVDGYNPLAVADAIKRKKQVIAEGRGPVLLDTITYRISGHSPSDASSYREKSEIELWQQADPIVAYAAQLKAEKLIDDAKEATIKADIKALVIKALKLAIDLTISPRLPAEDIAGLMYSNQKVMALSDAKPQLNHELKDNARIQQLAGKVRSLVGAAAPVPKPKQYTVSDAIFEATAHHFSIDPTLVAYGEENRDWGGAFGAYRGLTELLPYHRLFNSPISEGAIVGTACGYALEGGRALVELMYCDFLGRAGDEVFNQLAKWQSMSAQVLKMPVTLRVSVGAKYGAQHSQDWVALCAHIPGLKVAFPVTPYDAKGILHSALSGTDPVIYFESQRLYQNGEEFEKDVPAGFYTIPEGEPVRRRAGSDITILTIGSTMYRALEAAKTLEAKYGVKAEVWDARWVVPFNYEPIVESVKRTGRLVVASDACERGSYAHTMASTISRLAFGHLDAPACVIGTRNWISPGAEMEADYFPQPAWIIDAIHENVLPLKGHVVTGNQTGQELIKRARAGV